MHERFVSLLRVGPGALAILASGFVSADELGPFRATNLSPPIAIVGLPLWSTVPDRITFGVTTELASHYRLSQRVEDRLVLDGETLRLRGYFEKPFGERWSVAVDVPYYYQSGGILDDLIDAWHSAFGLPDGARNQRPEGLLEYRFGDADGSFFELSDSGGGPGDIQLSVARHVGSGRGWHLRGTVKLATGKESLLAGSGASDWALSALRLVEAQLRGRAASVFFGGALIGIGQPDRIRFPVEDEAVAGILGGALTLGERFGIKAQIDANSAVYNSRLEELGQTAVQATVGGWLRFAETGIFEYAISEDLHVNTTPDVAIVFNVSWRLP